MYEHFKQLSVGSQVENDGSWFAIAVGLHVIRGIHAHQTTHTVKNIIALEINHQIPSQKKPSESAKHLNSQ
jgi:hypothetical protein